MLPFLFTTLKRHLGTEYTKWWSVSGVILSHSSCKQVLRWATVRGLRCRILRFKMRHTFSIGDRSGLQAGQSSTRTLFLCSQDFVMCAECGFALSCWNMHGHPGKDVFLKAAYCAQNLYVLFSINDAITEVQVTFAKGTDTTPYHDRPWLLDLLLVTVWMILFFFGPEHTASIPPKNTWNTDSSDHSTRFHCVMVHPRCLRAQRSRRRFWTLLTYGFLLAQYSF